MKVKSFAKRLLASLLAFTLTLTSLGLPVGVVYAEEPTYVLAGSDFQASSHNAGATIVNDIVEEIVVDYPTMDGFLFAGDYDVNYEDSENGKIKLQQTIQGVYGTKLDEIYVQGNHDKDSLVGSVLTNSGANDAENYGVFVINEKDYMWYNNDEMTIRNTANNLETYLNAKRNAGYTKPIFVISHLPLHYNMRTRSGGNDGMHANYIFDVLNEAGTAGLNIIFLFGHNHSHGWDDYLGGSSIFLTKGDKINIAQNSITEFKEETLAFTYMNAGYVGYYGTSYTSDVDKTLTMTTFAITDKDVTISRYDGDNNDDGHHLLKSSGVYNVEYPDNRYYSCDTTTVDSPYVLTLNKNITGTGEEVDAPSTETTPSERTYTRVTSTSELVSGGKYLIIHNGQNDFMIPTVTSDGGTRIGYDLVSAPNTLGNNTISGDYSSYEWTLESTTGGWKINSSSGYMYFEKADDRVAARLGTTAHTFAVGGSANSFTFTNKSYSNGNYVLNYNSTGDLINGYASGAAPFYIYKLTSAGGTSSSVQTSGGNYVTITKPTEGTKTYVYTLATSITSGQEYVIVGNNHTVALMDNNGNIGKQTVTINGLTMTSTTELTQWTFSRVGNYFGSSMRIYDGTRYLYYGNSNFSLNSSYTNFTVTDNGSNFRIQSGTRSLYYNGSTWTRSGNNTAQYVRLYQLTDTTTSESALGLYGKIDGELVYQVPAGTSKEDALQIVKDGITIKYATAANYSDEKTYPDDGDGITWTLDSNYSGAGGEYAVTIKYNNVVLGVAKVVVPTATVKGYTVEPARGLVYKGVSQNSETGAYVYVQLDNDKYYKVPVTVGMLTNADGSTVSTGEEGTFENLTLTYNGVVITKEFTLVVTMKTGNDYPEYPNEGAVKVGKSATGIDFQASGIAQVELTASGVPVKKGADVIVMLDLSSSMNNEVDGKTRLSVLEDSLQQMMTQFQAIGDDGEPMDIRLAVADFNRYYTDSSSTYYGDPDDHMTGGSVRSNNAGTNKVYTGSKKFDASAFVNVNTLEVNEFDGLTVQSGTNYDYAFDAIYQLGEAITVANAQSGEERDLYVIFMSDGAPFQYNYFGSQSEGNGSTYWNNYLTGTATSNMFASGSNTSYYNEDGKHWMAEAIKGDPSETYPVIRKNDSRDTDKDNWIDVNGLGATMYSIGFCLAVDKSITVDTMDTVIRNIASEEKFYYRADNASALSDAFDTIGSEIAYAATNARFVDTMGQYYDIQLAPSTYNVKVANENGELELIERIITPTIEVNAYDIYTKEDAANGNCTTSQIGTRKDSFRNLETVTFSTDADGKVNGAYSGESEENILINGVICANTFWYNTNASNVQIDTNNDGVNDYTLAPETFYWKIGTINNQEISLKYYVYLTDSREGGRPAGSYATNNSAVLYYDNYLGHACQKDTTSPVLAWESAHVSYAFYLVNSKGEIIVNQTTGETGTFANKVAITSPVVYKEVLLNNEEEIEPLQVVSSNEDVLPDGYTLYDDQTAYTVNIQSNGTGSWTIAQDSTKVDSTYVTEFAGTGVYSNETNVNDLSYDYTHTTVWFAVVWEIKPINDTVVIDYGLPVNISVLQNDMFGENGKLIGVGKLLDKPEGSYTTTDSDLFKENLQSTFGNAAVNGDKVKYQLKDSQMNSYDKFAYEVQYTNSSTKQYYYADVTVIPATTIYYEDNYISFEAGDNSTQISWSPVDSAIDTTQGEDRPGKYSLPTIDANNVYGYDGAYATLANNQFSNGGAKSVTLTTGQFARATFSFWGTGFDIVSLTSNKTGLLTAKVTNASGTYSKNLIVDTYYGYAYDETNGWYPVDTNSPNAIYQVPVLQLEGLAYDNYTVTLTASYSPYFDHTGEDKYTVYLDAVRVYNPANTGVNGTDTTILDAYLADDEAYPQYFEIRNEIIEAEKFNSTTNEDIKGVVFIDSDTQVNENEISSYISYGPNNEVYLAKNQAIAFKLDLSAYEAAKVADVQIGLKSADGNKVSYKIYNALNENSAANATERVVETSTDMYYSIKSLKDNIIVITNVGESGMLSLTNIKVTLENAPSIVTSAVQLFTVNKVQTAMVFKSLRYRAPAVFEPTTFEVTSNNNVELGDLTNIEVTTSTDVEYIYANDQYFTSYTEENGLRTFTVQLETTELGELTVYLTAYNADGTGSSSIATVVNVVEPTFTPELFELTVLENNIHVGDTMTIVATTSADVEFVTIAGEVVKEYTLDANGNKVWTKTMTAETVGDVNVEATATNAKGVEADVVTLTVNVSEEVTIVTVVTNIVKAVVNLLSKLFGRG